MVLALIFMILFELLFAYGVVEIPLPSFVNDYLVVMVLFVEKNIHSPSELPWDLC
jgi:hypothetical protein